MTDTEVIRHSANRMIKEAKELDGFPGTGAAIRDNEALLALCDEADRQRDEIKRLREVLEIVQIGLTGYVTLEEAKCLYDEIESALYPPEDKP